MAKVFADIDMSLDGFVAGDGISPERPLGVNGERLIWYADDVNDDGADMEDRYGEVDGRVLREAADAEGAVIMGRRTFDLSIEAWGEEPPIHKPCFVLTSRQSVALEMRGGTTFTFVTGGAEEAIRRAKHAAEGGDVGVMGGALTIRSFLEAGLLDELHLHIVPVLLGSGLRLFDSGIDGVSGPSGGYGPDPQPALNGTRRPGPSNGVIELEKVRALDGERAVHLVLRQVRADH